MVVSDIHFETGSERFHDAVHDQSVALDWLLSTIDYARAEQVIMLGDLGRGWDTQSWQRLTDKAKVNAIYGNHDDVYMMQRLLNADRCKVQLGDGEIVEIGGLSFGFINGIASKTGREKNFVPRKTPEEFRKISMGLKGVDFLCTHESPIVEIYKNRMQRSPGVEAMNYAIHAAMPKFVLSGHLSFSPYTAYPTIALPQTVNIRVESSQKHRGFAVIDSTANTIELHVDKERRGTLQMPDGNRTMDMVAKDAAKITTADFGELFRDRAKKNAAKLGMQKPKLTAK